MIERCQLGHLLLPSVALGHKSRHSFFGFGFTSENKMAVLVTVEAPSSTYHVWFQVGM